MRPRFKCSEQRCLDSRAVSPGTMVPGCQQAWCPHECVHPSPASWPPPRGPAERAGGRVLTWGFLCRGSGPFLRTPPSSWCRPGCRLTLWLRPHRWCWAHGLCLENPDERALESWKLMEKTLPRGVQAEMLLLFPSSWYPTPSSPPKRKKAPRGKEGGRQIPPSCSARTHMGTQGRTPAARWLPKLSGLVPDKNPGAPHKPDTSGDPDASVWRVSSRRCEHGARMQRACADSRGHRACVQPSATVPGGAALLAATSALSGRPVG